MKAWLVLALGLVLALAMSMTVLIGGAPAAARAPRVLGQVPCDRYVLGIDASDHGDCSDEAHPCRTVPYAVAHAADGDRVCVADHSLAPGPTVYNGTVVLTRSLILDGKWQAACVDPSNLTCAFTAVECAPERVVLDALGAGRVISIAPGVAPTVDCFTITGGDAAGLGGDPGSSVDNDAGGGIYGGSGAAPTIVNNVIEGNYGCQLCPASYCRGGGIYLLEAPATAVISGNLIVGNVADESTWGEGGGIMLRDSQALVAYNRIARNRAGHSAGDGGGILVAGGAPEIAFNDILTNVAGVAVMGNGGGLFVWMGASPLIHDNQIAANVALSGTGDPLLVSRGGGLFYAGAPGAALVFERNVVQGNVAATGDVGRGGGVYLSGVGPTSAIADNVVAGNEASRGGDGDGGGYYLQDCDLAIAADQVRTNVASSAGEGRGGGLFARDCTLAMSDVLLEYNLAGGIVSFGRGGGAFLSNTVASLVGNQFIENQASPSSSMPGSGGGVEMYLSSGSQLRDNLFFGNRGPVYGGAVFLQASDGVTLSGNTMTTNLANEGGGVYALHSDGVLFDANWILDNRGQRGGGLYLYDSAGTLDNNVIAENDTRTFSGASGVEVVGDRVVLRHNTIARNGIGSGVNVSSYWGGTGVVALTNTIVVSHNVGIQAAADSVAELEGTLWGAGPWANDDDWAGLGTITIGVVRVPAPGREGVLVLSDFGSLGRLPKSGTSRPQWPYRDRRPAGTCGTGPRAARARAGC